MSASLLSAVVAPFVASDATGLNCETVVVLAAAARCEVVGEIRSRWG